MDNKRDNKYWKRINVKTLIKMKGAREKKEPLSNIPVLFYEYLKWKEKRRVVTSTQDLSRTYFLQPV